MRHDITFKNFETHDRLNTLIERLIAGLERQTSSFRQEAVFLHGIVEKNPTRELYRISLVLNLPGRTLVAQDERHDAEAVIREAFIELERQLKKYKELLRNEHLWKRPARREAVRQERKLGVAPATERQRLVFLDIIEPHLEKLYNFVRREIAAYLATGDLAPGDLSAEDVVDAVVLTAFRSWDDRPARLEIDRWLLRLAIDHLAAEVKRINEERAVTVHVEEDVPETPPEEEVVTLGDEIFDFYQPDEDLRLEDIVPDPYVPTPDQVLESRDLQRYINQTLAQLPRAWRMSFVLYHLEGLSIPEIAEVTGQRVVEVRRNLRYAREFLREKLMESGLKIAA
ncbi:MAG: sigma-70 family RNA polymerase sigma factor [Acidobacteria bacterium]|nr:MAG: sigma-70 family RNA polymerase sigma factor [Acidobacteriota bacterium]